MSSGIEGTWGELLIPEFEKPYMKSLKSFLHEEIMQNKTIFPPGALYFHALNKTPYENVKVVILGQDPYHGPGQAHGLCFSVQVGVKPPPSLQNIYKEMKADLDLSPPEHGNLERWAEQGVLLLNSVLTVEKGRAGAHQNKGWEQFTDRIIEIINEVQTPTAFLLWGAYAQKKGDNIDRSKHLVIQSPHPSPFSANRGFFGSAPFSKINRFLLENGREPVDWDLNTQH